MAKTYDYAELNVKTNTELREICATLGILGVSKKRKDEIVPLILAKASKPADVAKPVAAAAPTSKYNRSNLSEMTAAALTEICKGLGIPGMSKKAKDVMITAILAKEGPAVTASHVAAKPVAAKSNEPNVNGITSMEVTLKNKVTSEYASSGRISTTVHVSCGASAGNFSVIGKTVGQAGEYLKEVLNVGSNMPRALVNGKEVTLSYVLQEGDNLEFLKGSGRKG